MVTTQLTLILMSNNNYKFQTPCTRSDIPTVT